LSILEQMYTGSHEQLLICSEPSVGLKALIAIHDTTLGPACGGCRIWPHKTEEDAISDVLRLSQAMTYKAAAADLSLGGGKALIIADPRTDKTEGLMRALGVFIDSLGGKYITTEDVGCTPRDIEYVARETQYAVGLPTSMGGSGETSIMTGLGVYLGMKACAKSKWGSDSLSGKRIALQGFGHVSERLAPHLIKEGAQLIVCDLYEDATEKAKALGAQIVEPKDIYDVDCDIFAPNALGGVLNNTTIPRLKCDIIAGGANNQLLTKDDAITITKKNILYGPDYIINAGGIINASCEIGSAYSESRAKAQTERIYETTLNVIEISKREDITTAEAADRLAKNRIETIKALRRFK